MIDAVCQSLVNSATDDPNNNKSLSGIADVLIKVIK